MQIYVKKANLPPQITTTPKALRSGHKKIMILSCRTLNCYRKTNTEFSYFLKEGYLAC